MTELSPQAQAVLDAAFPVYDDEHLYVATGEQHAGMIAAAALRTAVDQVVPEELVPRMMRGPDLERLAQRQHTRAELLTIAAELEAHQ
jgi:hypothetical protein